MKRVLLAALALAWAFGAQAQVGVRDLTLRAADGRPAPARLWYPTASSNLQPQGATRISEPWQAAPDAPPLPGAAPAPLILLLHGTAGHRDGLGWLATALAREGAWVLAATHPGSGPGSKPADILRPWTQPEDARAFLDQLPAQPWAQHIDPSRLAAVGYSLGGASVLQLAGARMDLQRLAPFCAQHDTGACRYFRPAFTALDAEWQARAARPQHEPRLRAVVALAPGLTETLEPSSLRALPTPLLLVSAGQDGQLPPALHARPLHAQLPAGTRHLEIADAGHFIFMPPMKPNACAVLAEDGEEFVCWESPQMPRAQAHALLLQELQAFLRAQGVLK
ncbi:alpha/beta hydrolase family protein [Inhella gelatinilytica]|uniref:Alpha/beta hydrolase n=1 Tax=Inhella gelatinilytica TaxID=2795030 RepID=A0A931IRW1_9BURK|nr:alpha/beta fold hydrolase [Inhella gelatinilytica]MBH9551545.1 alpha/beta hydrolase [Inhella gelatinilytica]